LKGKIFVAGYDGEPAEVNFLKEGVFTMIVIQKPLIEGTDGVLFAYDYLTGHKAAIPKSVALTNVVATQENVNSPAVAPYIYETTPVK